MKIFCCDNASFKFSQALLDHWRDRGHDVMQEMGMNPEWLKWSDLTFIDFMDNNFYRAFNGPNGDHDLPDWQPEPKKRIAVRLIDIDIWQGRHRDPRIWPYLDDAIVINKFYYDMIHDETTPYSEGKLHMIPMGVDLSKFTLREKKERGYKIGCVTGNLWEAKDGFGAIRIFQELVRLYPDKPWELHIRGQYFPPEWRTYAYERLIDVSGLRDRIFIVPPLSGTEGMNDWYHSMDYTLVTSHKEAFSFAAAEGMACGLKPVINNFFGSDDVWPAKYKFSSIHEAVMMLAEGDYNPEEYRQEIEDNHNIQTMFKSMDDLFGT
jgi:glycosyltransferase involved in cell wall biosynthesis